MKSYWNNYLFSGAILTALAFGAKQIPVTHGGLNLPQANGICTSALGIFAQAFSHTAQNDCGTLRAWEQITGWAIVVGIALAAFGAFRSYRKNHPDKEGNLDLS